jgi:hypothetical protein
MTALSKNIGSFIKYLALILICVQAFSIRLFSVVKYESVIHEFDPYFNYRVTQFLTKEGFYNLWNWFDENTWYPLGRVVGGTVYPVRDDAGVRAASAHASATLSRAAADPSVVLHRASSSPQE